MDVTSGIDCGGSCDQCPGVLVNYTLGVSLAPLSPSDVTPWHREVFRLCVAEILESPYAPEDVFIHDLLSVVRG